MDTDQTPTMLRGFCYALSAWRLWYVLGEGKQERQTCPQLINIGKIKKELTRDMIMKELIQMWMILEILTEEVAVRLSLESWIEMRCAMCVLIQLCPTLCDPLDCSPPGSSVHGIFQARILEWVAISFRGSSWPRHQTCVSLITGGFFICWAIREMMRELILM